MRMKSYYGAPALTCQRRVCGRCALLWFTYTRAGRVVLAIWLVLAVTGVLLTLTACDPVATPGTPRPLQSGTQPAPMYTVIKPAN